MTYEHMSKQKRPLNYTLQEWEEYLKYLKERDEKEAREKITHFKISFKGRSYEDRWTRYRTKALEKIGLSDDEILELKYNRMTNPRVAMFLRDIRAEVERIRVKYELADYSEAANYRRDHYEELLDTHDIEDWDPYYRMGYFE